MEIKGVVPIATPTQQSLQPVEKPKGLPVPKEPQQRKAFTDCDSRRGQVPSQAGSQTCHMVVLVLEFGEIQEYRGCVVFLHG